MDDVDTIASISSAVISIITEARAPAIRVTQAHPCYMSTERKARRVLSFQQSRNIRMRQSSVARCALFLLRPLKTPPIGRVNIQAGGMRFFWKDKHWHLKRAGVMIWCHQIWFNFQAFWFFKQNWRNAVTMWENI